MPDYGWLFDPKRCIECKACEAACKQWNGVSTGSGIHYRRVHNFVHGVFPRVRANALSMACNHCIEATCVKVCPTRAVWRRADGIVLVQEEKCVGCGLCVKFCPYEAPQVDQARRKMEKCTMCADRIDAGLQPACASVCPTHALQWGRWDEISHQGAAQVEDFSTPVLTKPAIRFVTEPWTPS
ncbi:MAG: 4Fe-4S dicluster domain-containing protein [Bryobacterales bacterium]|nr:4Fe-4S dicluster domain-containing protein [Bryobacterales bacterium]